MFIRQFSLRLLLIIITACAGFSLILSFAWRGSFWAISLAAFLAALLATVLVQGVVFWLVWLFSVAAERWRQRRPHAAMAHGGALDATRSTDVATARPAAQE
jgi:uncharacterized membrane protein